MPPSMLWYSNFSLSCKNLLFKLIFGFLKVCPNYCHLHACHFPNQLRLLFFAFDLVFFYVIAYTLPLKFLHKLCFQASFGFPFQSSSFQQFHNQVLLSLCVFFLRCVPSVVTVSSHYSFYPPHSPYLLFSLFS